MLDQTAPGRFARWPEAHIKRALEIFEGEGKEADAAAARKELAHRSQPLQFTYRNYKGELAERRVRPLSIWYGATEWHPTPGWLLRAYDIDKAAELDFAMADIGPSHMIHLREAANAASYAMRELESWDGGTRLPARLRQIFGRAYHVLEAALLGRPKPTFEDEA